MAQAAALHGVQPRRLSFTAAFNHMHHFEPKLEAADAGQREPLEQALLAAIAKCKVRKRPGRKGPRAVKKRPNEYPYLTKPRAQARKERAT